MYKKNVSLLLDTKITTMNRNLKIAIGVVVVAGLGYLAYRYFFAPKSGDKKSVGGDDSSEVVYDKASRNIEINEQ